MISRSNYQGRLPYEEYIKRFQSAQDLDKELKQNVKKEITKQIGKKTNEMSENFKKEMKERGIDTDKIEEMAGILEGQGKLNDKQRQALYTGFLLSKAGKPNTQSLSQEEIIKANRVEASKLGYLHDDNFETAQAHLDSLSMEDNGVIDTELSTPDSLVIKKPNGKVEIAYRGTQLSGKPSLEDISTDASIAVGADRDTPQFKRADDQIKSAFEKYGRENVESLTGYSLGGTKALSMGQKYGIESTTFNPFIGPRLARGVNTTEATHNIIRTTTDFASTGLIVSKDRNLANWNVKSLRPIAENEHLIPIKETYDGHRLNNFTSNKGRITGIDDNALQKAIKAQHEKQTLLAKKGLQHRTATLKEQGATFSEAVADLQKDSRGSALRQRGIDGNDIILGADGKPLINGSRHSPTSEMIRNWRALGGEFTDEEANVIADASGIPKTANQRNQAQENLRNKLRADRQAVIDDMPSNTGYFENGNFVSLKTENQKKLDQDYPIEQQTNPQDRLQKAFDAYDESGIGNKAGNKRAFNKPDLNFSESDSELESSINQSPNERQTEIENIGSEIEGHNEDIQNAMDAHEAAGLNEHMRGLSATHMGIGAGIGYLTDQTLNFFDPNDKGQGKIQGVDRDIVSGATSGFLTAGASSALGLAEEGLGPAAVAGAAGYVAADYGAKGGQALAKMAGASKSVQEDTGDALGGTAGGLAAYLGGTGAAVAADALLGTEYGATLGPEGAAVGGAIGLGLGLGSAAVSEISKTKIGKNIVKGAEAGVGTYLAGGAAAIGADAVFGTEIGASLGPGGAAIGAAVGTGVGLLAYGIHKFF